MRHDFISSNRLFDMGISAGAAALIAAGVGAASTGGQAIATGKLNKKNRKWQENMYWIQQEQNRNNFLFQNEYNSPSAQMQRLEAAGLNPNMVYGSGANAGAVGTVGNSSVGTPKTESPDFSGFGGAAAQGLSAYMDIKTKNVVMDNLVKQGEVLEMERLNKAAEVEKKHKETEKMDWDMNRSKSFFDTDMSFKTKSLERLGQTIDLSYDANDRAWLANARAELKSTNDAKQAASQILNDKLARAKGSQEIRNLELTAENLKQTNALGKLDQLVKEHGHTYSSPLIEKIFMKLVDGKNPNQIPVIGGILDPEEWKRRVGSTVDWWKQRFK